MLSIKKEILFLVPAIAFGSYLLRATFLEEIPPPKVIENFVNAQDLTLSSESSVTLAQVQDSTSINPMAFVGNDFAYYPTQNVGDRLSFELPVSRRGRFNLTVFFVKGRDFGVIDVAISGTPLAKEIDLYDATSLPVDPIKAEGIQLEPGSTLEVIVTGKNPSSNAPHHQIGFDGVSLQGPL